MHGVADATVIEPNKGVFNLDLGAIWAYRELLYFLIWRDVKVRYKQTAVGAAWAIIQPLMTMGIFTVVFGHFVRIPSNGVAYPLYAYAALLPWTYFSQAVARSGASLVGDANLISKVYFPRVIVPLAAVLAPLMDFAITFATLIAMMIWFGVAPTIRLAALPLAVAFAVATALSVGLWVSALNVRYRDVGHTIPFLTQFWMFASPVAYPTTLVPERWLPLYRLNPMAGVIETFRWTVLGGENPDIGAILAGALVVTALLTAGIVYFTRMEQTFADVV